MNGGANAEPLLEVAELSLAFGRFSSSPANRTLPVQRAPAGCRPISASAATVLPQPDSPTTPRVSPRYKP